jgi:hypothetical protein
MDVRYIRGQDLIRGCGSKVATDEVRGRDGVPVPVSGAFPATSDAALKTRFAHQSGNPLRGAARSKNSELGMDAWVAIDFAAPVMDFPYLLDERCVFTVSFGGQAIFPTVVAAPRDLQYLAQQQRNRVVGLLLRSMNLNNLIGSRPP